MCTIKKAGVDFLNKSAVVKNMSTFNETNKCIDDDEKLKIIAARIIKEHLKAFIMLSR